MTTWAIAMGLAVLVALPRLLMGRTPQEAEETPRRDRRSSLREDGLGRWSRSGWDVRR